MSVFRSVICIVLDGVGVGEAPDAEAYGDSGSNSLANTARRVGSLHLPVLERMGLGNIVEIDGVARSVHPAGCFGKMKPAASGKDSITGHWELMGCVLREPFPTYPHGFPREIIEAFERSIGRKVLGNKAASGTAIIQELGAAHTRTGHPILYTSQDSVFQLAAHEEVVSVDELYGMCEVARRLLVPPNGLARVIARPFTGAPGTFHRTAGRRDFALPPIQSTLLDELTAENRKVLTIGKISELFCGRGITQSIPTRDNRDGISETLRAMRDRQWDLVFVNLVDFDTMWGHRNDARAYALGLEEFDSYLNDLLDALHEQSLLMITSDHGNDPTTQSTDHSREYVPLIAYHHGMARAGDLGVRNTLADVAATIGEIFDITRPMAGQSFLGQVSR